MSCWKRIPARPSHWATLSASNEYTFTLASDKRLYFDSQTDSANIVWWLTQSAIGQVVAPRTLGASNTILDLAAGSYTLTLDGTDLTTGSYAFRLFDVNSAATSLTPGVVVNGALAPANTSVAYQFSGDAGERFAFDAISWNGSSAARWRLLNESGYVVFDELLTDDVSTFALPETGTYTLLIEGDIADTDSSKAYSFVVNPEMAPSSTQSLTLNSTVNGSISLYRETDDYTFTLSSAAVLYFDTLTNDSSLNWSLTGPQGEFVSRRAFNTRDSILPLAAGSYTHSDC
jgi:hypothetical protein